MAYTARSRDRYKTLAALSTGVVVFGTVTATGAVTGLAAHETSLRDQAQQEQQARQAAKESAAYQRKLYRNAARVDPGTVTIERSRPHRTVVHTRVVHQAGAPGVAQVGGGAPVTSAPTTTGSAGSSGGSSTAALPPPAPPPPPPKPPAPSSGS